MAQQILCCICSMTYSTITGSKPGTLRGRALILTRGRPSRKRSENCPPRPDKKAELAYAIHPDDPSLLIGGSGSPPPGFDSLRQPSPHE